jgi:Ca-activated chloride channel family protein
MTRKTTALCLFLMVCFSSSACRFVDLWLTPDQQGRYFFERGDYARAAERFQDPLWKGIACYHDEDWDCAIDQFARLDTADAYYNLGNAYANAESYELAVEAYDEALQRVPEWSEARENRDLVAELIPMQDEEEEEGAPPGEPNLDPDEIVFDEQGEKGKLGEVQQSLFSDEQVAEMWLRGVETSPADFLRMKFVFQAQESERRTSGREQ